MKKAPTDRKRCSHIVE